MRESNILVLEPDVIISELDTLQENDCVLITTMARFEKIQQHLFKATQLMY